MEKIRIYPAKLQGRVTAPSSKSMGHREIICAALAEGVSVVDNISMSQDIEATCRCLRAMGVQIEKAASRFTGRSALRISGTGRLTATADGADCGESGSTLRFFIPLAALLDAEFTFTGGGKLASRPLQAYYDIFDSQGIFYRTSLAQTGEHLPLTVKGRLKGDLFRLPGNVSSQYVSGLLFALPLAQGDSVIEITSPLESAAYVDMTLACLQKYGVTVTDEGGAHRRYLVRGGQRYRAQDGCVEGDWSQAAFWVVGGALGQEVACDGLDFASLQGDKAVAEIMRRMGAELAAADGCLTVRGGRTRGTVIDGSGCPDIIPVLTALAAVSEGHTSIVNAGRLRLKECDRLAAMTRELNKLGAQVTELPDGLEINGVAELACVPGLEVDAWNDHRIAMSLAIAAQKCREPIVLTGAGSVSKSYPTFWEDYAAVGGRTEVLA